MRVLGCWSGRRTSAVGQRDGRREVGEEEVGRSSTWAEGGGGGGGGPVFTGGGGGAGGKGPSPGWRGGGEG